MNQEQLQIKQNFLLDRSDWAIICVLMLLVFVSRVPFRATTLFEGDCVHFALGMQNYNVSEYRPHPPGYFFYIGTANIFDLFYHDENTSLTATAIFFSMGTVILLYLLAKELFSRDVGIIASLLFLFTPFFWFYGEVALSYASGAFGGLLIAFLGYRAHLNPLKPILIYVNVFLLGISAGFRQDILIYMSPLLVFIIFQNRYGWKVIANAILLFVVSITTWYIPMINLSGGYEAYSHTTSAQLLDYVYQHSIIFGNNILDHIRMVKDFVLVFIGASYFALIYCLTYLIIERASILSKMKNFRFTFLMMWLLPAIIFFTIVFFEQPGYLLTILPAVYIIFAVAMIKISKKFVKSKNMKLILGVQVIVIFAIHAYNFLGDPPVKFSNWLGKSFTEKNWSASVVSMAYTAFFQHTRWNITESENSTLLYTNAIRSLPYEPEQVAILHFHRSNWYPGLDFFYLPEFATYCLEDYRTSLDKIRYGKNHKISQQTKDKVVLLNPNIKCIAIICNGDSPSYQELKKQLVMKEINTDNSHDLFTVEMCPITFNFRDFKFRVSPTTSTM